ncbi:MAG: hypothetical protein WC815_04370 [Vicinamibacterales bacterium]
MAIQSLLDECETDVSGSRITDPGVSFCHVATAASVALLLDAVASQPLVASVDRLLAIVGDPSRDLDGGDAAGKLALLITALGWGGLAQAALDVSGLRGATPDDQLAATANGGTLKHVAFAERDDSGVRAFAGPAFLPVTDPLAIVGGALHAIRLDGKYVTTALVSGPGAGPARVARLAAPTSPVTPWFVRATFPGVVPSDAAIASLVNTAGLNVVGIAAGPPGRSRWLLVGPQTRAAVAAAVARLRHTHRVDAVPFRRMVSTQAPQHPRTQAPGDL